MMNVHRVMGRWFSGRDQKGRGRYSEGVRMRRFGESAFGGQ